MADRGGFLNDADRRALERFPLEVDDHDLRHCFAVSELDRSDIVDRRYGPAGRLAAGLQLGALRLIGFVPSDLSSAPVEIISYVAGQIGATPSDLVDYTTRTKTRYGHVEAIEQFLGFRRSDQGDLGCR